MRQILGQMDEYSPTKKIKQFRAQSNLPFSHLYWWIKNLMPILWDESGAQISTKTQHKQWRTCGKKFRPKYPRSKAYLVPDREWTKLVFRKQNVLTFLPGIFFLWFVYRCASSPGCKQHMKVLVWIFSAQYGPGIKLQKVGRNVKSFRRG